jgi:hypothetical protein
MIALESESSVRVKAGTAVEITCVAGVLWVTQEGDPRDLFLAPGESLRLAGRGLTIVTALEPSFVRLVEGARISVRSSTWLRVLRWWRMATAALVRLHTIGPRTTLLKR